MRIASDTPEIIAALFVVTIAFTALVFMLACLCDLIVQLAQIL